MRRLLWACLLLFVSVGPALPQVGTAGSRASNRTPAFRPPAVPLVAVDPYFSIWSFADHLTYDSTRHWTGMPMPMHSLVRIDGKVYRIMGDQPGNVEPARQVSLHVFPTRTVYQFQAGGVSIELTFLTPDLPQDLDVLARPVTYLTWTVRSVDRKKHRVQIYYDNTGELVVNSPDELVARSRADTRDLDVLTLGTAAQPILGRAGDRVRIDWGHLYVAAPILEGASHAVDSRRRLLGSFLQTGELPGSPAAEPFPNPSSPRSAAAAFAFTLLKVGTHPTTCHLILAYDEINPIEYFHQRLKPWWQHSGTTIDALLETAEREYPQLMARSEQFDSKLMAALTQAGGPEYADVAALAYRQAFAANKLAISPKGEPLMFLKEISSCGCAQTADVIYPEAPLLLFLNPKLLEYSLEPLLDYAQSGQWPYPWAPHDLGTYPLDNARVPSKMESMPVEETGNMLLMIAGIAKAEGNADFARRYWPLLSRWADYLKQNGLDPGDQLCTDDFTGLLAHNANLALKAVEALGSYAMLSRMLGHPQQAASAWSTARQYAREWMKRAADGDHTRLAYDRPGTWSQKYNLAWDRVLGLNLFPPSLAASELAYYQAHSTPFGFPLDSRSGFTKLDWESWCAALASSRQQFRTAFAGVFHFAQATPTRVPLSDWYWTVDGSQTGFQARPVVGGVFMWMLKDGAAWSQWARRQQ